MQEMNSEKAIASRIATSSNGSEKNHFVLASLK
jgi:hypothetical protein